MDKSLKIITTSFFFLPILIDQFFKLTFGNITILEKIGPLYFKTIFNKGIIFGILPDLNPMMRIVIMASIYGAIISFYLLIQYLLINRLAMLRIGLSLLTGGIGGNVIDRIIYGHTIDFIGFTGELFFNLSDVFQIIGSILIIFSVFKYQNQIWHLNCLRKNYLIDFKFQTQFALKFVFIGLCMGLTLGLFSISFFTSILDIPINQILVFSISFLAIIVIFSLLSFFAGLIISHRTAGPLQAFEIFVEDLIDGKDRKLTLRTGDNHKHLEHISEKLRMKMKGIK